MSDMSDEPEEPDNAELDWLAQPPTVVEAIEDLRELIDDLYDVPLDEMTEFFYVSAYNALIETGRYLVQTLDEAGISDRGSKPWP